jgi:hypothetical protein
VDSVLATFAVVAAFAGVVEVVMSGAEAPPSVVVAAALADGAELTASSVAPAALVAVEAAELARPDAAPAAVPAAEDTVSPTVLVAAGTA